jgi:hypothetical protein
MKRIRTATGVDVGSAVDSFFTRPPLRARLDYLRACFPQEARFLVAGGAIRNLIIELIHGSAPPTRDIDLFIAAVDKDFALPQELTAGNIHPTELGGWRWQPRGCPYAFDLCLLPNFAIIAKYGLAPTLENLLQSVDFTVNAVVYDVAGRRLFEHHCISDISRRVIEFNTRRMATKLLHAYRVLLVGHKTGFRLSEKVFEFVRGQLDVDTLSSLKQLLSSKQGERTARLILNHYDRICRCADYGEYLRLN